MMKKKKKQKPYISKVPFETLKKGRSWPDLREEIPPTDTLDMGQSISADWLDNAIKRDLPHIIRGRKNHP